MNLYIKTKDFGKTKEAFEIISTEVSGILKTNPVPENLEKYYAFDGYISHQKKGSNLVEKLYFVAKQWNLKHKSKIVQTFHTKGRLLDFGAGTGAFANFMSQHFEVYAFEPSTIEKEENTKTQWITTLSEIPKESLQVITLWHVLEHVSNPKELIAELKSKLTPDGILVIAVPNYLSYDAKHFKSYWAAWDVPRHLWHFSEKGMLQLMEGWEIIKILPMVLDSLYVSILSAKYQKISLATIYGILVGLLSNIKAIFTKEWSSKIYIFKKQINSI